MLRFFLTLFVYFSLVTNLYAQDTRQVSATPKEIYSLKSGAKISVKIGNGGAGPTGVLKFLALDYLKIHQSTDAIAWYQDISPNTLQQLKNGVIDMALVYEKDQVDQAVKEGWATHVTTIFNDHFLIVGPQDNPAHLWSGQVVKHSVSTHGGSLEKEKNVIASRASPADDAKSAFIKIAQLGKEKNKPAFLSRDDNSATNVKEQTIWKTAKLQPWQGQSSWYVKSHVFPKDALLQANEQRLYTITDWGTWLSNKASLNNLKIYVRGGELLVNPCYAVLGKQPSKEVLKFLDYLQSQKGQHMVSIFNKNGFPLFTKASQIDF